MSEGRPHRGEAVAVLAGRFDRYQLPSHMRYFGASIDTSQPFVSTFGMTSRHDMPALMTAAEVADELRIPLATFYAWRHRGTGPPAYRVGRHLRFRRSDIDQWLDERFDTDHS